MISAINICHAIIIPAYSMTSNERVFICLKFIKNEIRSKCDDERLDSHVVLQWEKDLTDATDFESLSRGWTTVKNRRLKL